MRITADYADFFYGAPPLPVVFWVQFVLYPDVKDIMLRM
jgi:hypothetical protein